MDFHKKCHRNSNIVGQYKFVSSLIKQASVSQMPSYHLIMLPDKTDYVTVWLIHTHSLKKQTHKYSSNASINVECNQGGSKVQVYLLEWIN